MIDENTLEYVDYPKQDQFCDTQLATKKPLSSLLDQKQSWRISPLDFWTRIPFRKDLWDSKLDLLVMSYISHFANLNCCSQLFVAIPPVTDLSGGFSGVATSFDFAKTHFHES